MESLMQVIDQWKGNFNAPIKEMLKNGGLMILDVGSGTGTWTCDMSTDFPLNLYFGVEILPIFPHEKPRNIVFLINDILEGLPFRSNSFDYIHLRFMSLSLKPDVWQDKLINELARVLRPGGYLEIMENEITVSNRGPNVQEFFDRVHEELRSEGYNPTIIKLMKEFLINSGSFKNEDIKHTVMYVPMGEWGGKLSEMGLKTYYSLLKIFANMIKIPKKQNIDSYLDLINEEINNYKSFTPIPL
ncbi:S-adenosyl-L-methionine-dependent methyltransferase [Rhizophagus irregularis DAOM 181602=DAOM 197198]|nr:S-adenosyl-L-methionine-dependent methyltransferase [Rhizophagus irregularis DAOM 181602=DAOM 197198]